MMRRPRVSWPFLYLAACYAWMFVVPPIVSWLENFFSSSIDKQWQAGWAAWMLSYVWTLPLSLVFFLLARLFPQAHSLAALVLLLPLLNVFVLIGFVKLHRVRSLRKRPDRTG
jgi:hypothetical protein